MKILVIEDEIELANSIGQYLANDGYLCEYAKTLQEAVFKISMHDYDCILLDLMLPDGNGINALEEVKRTGKTAGVIIISAKDSIEERVNGLKIGADDYLSKPFHLSELGARIYSLIRRKNFANANLVVDNEVSIDLLAKTVFVNDNPILLTKTEYDLLLFLVSNKNWVSSKSALAEHISGDTADMFHSHDYVYAHIKNLKKKLSEAGYSDRIKTIYGMGYKWES